MNARPLVFGSLLLLLAVGGPVDAQIVLSQDFDSGSLDVAATIVTGTTVALAPRETWIHPTWDEFYRWVHFKANGVNQLTPEFRIDEQNFLGSLSGHRYVYSYDQTAWHFFDHGDVIGDEYVFRNDAPFTSDEVSIAYGIPYPVSRTAHRVAEYQTSAYVTPTVSASASLVIGQSPGGTDELGRSIPQHDLYAFQVTDPTATGPKQKIVIATGSHAGETPAHFALEGFVDFLLGPSLEAAQLRGQAEFFVYPQVNPDGRYAGYYRSSVENPDKDPNRFYDNPAGFTDLSQVVAAMVSDTGGDVDYVFDLHSWFGPWSDENFVFTHPDLVNSTFLQQLQLVEPEFEVSASFGQPGMLRIWGSDSNGLNAEYGYTAEIGAHPGRNVDRLLEYGENLARALLGSVGTRERCDLNFDGDCDGSDLDLLTAQGDLLAGVPVTDIKFDLDDNGWVDGDDLMAWLANAPQGQFPTYLLGDVNLDGTVDGLDFVIWNDAKFTSG
ncbi:MAG: M14-type cytosolic carboxypeptidase, partial [Planctomycetota bacterium]